MYPKFIFFRGMNRVDISTRLDDIGEPEYKNKYDQLK